MYHCTTGVKLDILYYTFCEINSENHFQGAAAGSMAVWISLSCGEKMSVTNHGVLLNVKEWNIYRGQSRLQSEWHR